MTFVVKLFVQKMYMYILYLKKDRNPRVLDYTPGSGQAVSGLHLSQPREAGTYINMYGAGIGQSVYRLTTGWTTERSEFEFR
jgi:hypothetical protein